MCIYICYIGAKGRSHREQWTRDQISIDPVFQPISSFAQTIDGQTQEWQKLQNVFPVLVTRVTLVRQACDARAVERTPNPGELPLFFLLCSGSHMPVGTPTGIWARAISRGRTVIVLEKSALAIHLFVLQDASWMSHGRCPKVSSGNLLPS